MAVAASTKTHCKVCGKDRATFRCAGCLEEFCHKHLGDHRQELHQQLDEIQVNRDLFRQSLTEQVEKPNNHLMIQQIAKWERDSIRKIQQTAEEAREIVKDHVNTNIHQLETKLTKLTDQLRESRDEDDFNEINLHQFQEQLERLSDQLVKPSNISIREDSTPFISKILIEVSDRRITPIVIASNIRQNTVWLQNGLTVAGGNRKGNALNQLNSPVGIYVDEDQTIYIADYENNRIVEWKLGATTGQVVAGGNGKGSKTNQLKCPTDVIVDKERNHLVICDRDNRRVVRWSRRNSTNGQTIIPNINCSRLAMDYNGDLYISDLEKNEVRRWKMNDTYGTIVAGGNGKGDRLNQLDQPAFVFVDEHRSVYVSDRFNHRVMKWKEGAKEGVVVAGGAGQGDSLRQLSYPQGLIVDDFGTVYVADYNNHRVMRWFEGATQGTVVVGGNEQGHQVNQFNGPTGLSFDRQGNLYVADYQNHRVQRFNIDRV